MQMMPWDKVDRSTHTTFHPVSQYMSYIHT